MKRLLSLLLAVLCLFSLAAAAAASADWRTIKTGHFTVFYKPGFEKPARTVLETLEFYRPAVEELIGNELFHLPVVIEDTGYANGFSNPVYNQIHLFITPPGPSSGLGAIDNWWSLVGVHEYIHALSLSKTAGLVSLLQAIFGNLVIPNIEAPGWIIEGITVFGESQFSFTQGRLNDGYYDAYIGACVADGRLPSIANATAAALEFPRDGSYLFGGVFFAYLAETYGKEKFAEFFAANGGNLWSIFAGSFLPTLGVDRSARKVYGKDFPSLWDEWLACERDRYKDFHIDGERVTKHGWFVQSPVIDGGRLFYQRNYPVWAGKNILARNEVVLRDLVSGKEEVLFRSTAGFVMPMRVHGGKLYYALEEIKRGFANATDGTFGSCAAIHELDLASGRDRALLTAEMRAYEILPDGKILYARDRKDRFGSELRLYDPAADADELLIDADYLVEEIAAGGGRLVVSAHYDWRNPGLFALSLKTLQLTPLVDTPYAEAGIGLDGDRLFFTSNYAGVHAVYCYQFPTGKTYRMTQGGYAAGPAFDAQSGRVYFVGLTSRGYDIFAKAAAFTEFTPAAVSAPSPPLSPIPPLDDAAIAEGGYADNLKTLVPAVHIPLAYADPDTGSIAFGLHMQGQDAVGDFSYQADLLYDFTQQKPDYTLQVSSSFLAPLQASLLVSNMLYDEPVIQGGLTYPLYVRQSQGARNVTAGLNILQLPISGFIVLAPYAQIALGSPAGRTYLSVEAPIYMAGGASAAAFYADIATYRYALGGGLSLAALGFVDPLGNTVTVRGFGPIEMEIGATASLEYSRTLLKIDAGLWSPSIFLQDAYGSVFADGAVNAATAAGCYSFGAELHLRGSLTTMVIPAEAFIGCVYTSDGSIAFRYGFGVGEQY